MSRPVAFGLSFLLILALAILNMRRSIRSAQHLRPDLDPAFLAEMYAVLTLVSSSVGAWVISSAVPS